MPFASWSDDLSVGVYEIDRQHRVLIDYLNELDAALTAKRPQHAFGPILDRLLDHTEQHFAYEERCMRERDYPHLEEHQREHRDLLDKVKDMRREFAQGRVLFTRAVVEFLHRWLLIHMQESDKRFGPYLRTDRRSVA